MQMQRPFQLVPALAALAMSLLALPAHSEELSDDEFCATLGRWAEIIMRSHQAGVPMVEMMETVSSSDLLRGMVVKAYGRHRYSDPEIRQRSIDDFRDEAVHACYTELLVPN
ncbi:hypothetical protein [Halodurantibacterium flavum]|uniref:hypothetical protein n=1 Tax=Halodurantibacterium flavum TaxID=1382802 RepID=UPI0036F35084